MEHKINTLGQLKLSGWQSTSIRNEIRKNVIQKIQQGLPLLEGLHGYEDSVVPQLEAALLAGHDVIFLGERGQGKSRIIRSLVSLMDEWVPCIAGSEVNDDPYHPMSNFAKRIVTEMGDETPIAWVHRDNRFGEKLATPDTSVADLIGDVDPIKVAEGRYLSDEATLHFGMIPRTNRGVFAINELPDLSERIQVGLLSILEERDVQIRGYRISLPLDIFLVASANPEDYTNRGRLITPLKDRFGSQIRTHYPFSNEIELAIVDQEAIRHENLPIDVYVPQYMREVVASVSALARNSVAINQKSGVSVRATVSNYEALSAAALRRALRGGDELAVVRVSDFWVLESSMAGKVELESIDDSDEFAVIEKLIAKAMLDVFRSLAPYEELKPLIQHFDLGLEISVGDDSSDAALIKLLDIEPLAKTVERIEPRQEPGAKVALIEFILEGLHLSKKLNKYESDFGAIYIRHPR